MKKFIALVALVLVSASTMMYAQESNAAARRAERKAQRDAERAKLRAEEEVQDMAAYQQAVHERQQSYRTDCFQHSLPRS